MRKPVSQKQKLIDFANRNPGWHSYAKDAKTKMAVSEALVAGAIEVNEFGQFKAVEKKEA